MPSLCSDWHLASTLLHVWAEISVSNKVRGDFAQLMTCRNDNGQESEEEIQLRANFLSSHGSSFRMWLLQSCISTIGAKRQLLWHTFLAKFYGLSRSGIRALAQFQLLSPLTSVDRHWKTLLLKYRELLRSRNALHAMFFVLCSSYTTDFSLPYVLYCVRRMLLYRFLDSLHPLTSDMRR